MPSRASTPTDPDTPGRDDPLRAVALTAIDPAQGGVLLRAFPSPERDALLAYLHAALPEGAPCARVPVNVSADRLLGGLDLPATLRAGRPVVARGLLAAADGGMIVLAMAERVARDTASQLCATLDAGAVALEREGIGLRTPTRFGVLALDEGIEDDERPPAALRDRLAYRFGPEAVAAIRGCAWPWSPEAIAAARTRLATVRVPAAVQEALCATALAFGLLSMRPSLQAIAAARAHAALDGREQVEEQDAVVAARLVLAPRALRLPQPMDDSPPPDEPEQDPPPDAQDESPPPEPEQGEDQDPDAEEPELDLDALSELLLDAALAAVPEGLLEKLSAEAGRSSSSASAGTSGGLTKKALRGRPTGVRAGAPAPGERLNLIETLRAAAPWQPLRRREGSGRRVEVRGEDFRVTRYAQRSATTTLFVVDASGSAAMQRLAEAKGAVELLLADCYARRDEVALIAFRGQGAELLLPPTRSLVRARRSLAGLPGGGGTPLAAAIDAALRVALDARRKGTTPLVVFLTDGRGNVTRDGRADRARAREETLDAARMLAASAVASLVIDTARRPDARAAELAEALGGTYQPLPFADAVAVSDLVKAAAPTGPGT
jgi:magnesium chelatase subunit D